MNQPDGLLAADALSLRVADAAGLAEGDAAGGAGPLTQRTPEAPHHQAALDHYQHQDGQHLQGHLGICILNIIRLQSSPNL